MRAFLLYSFSFTVKKEIVLSDRDDDSDHETVSDSDDVTDRDWHPSTPMKRPARRNVAKRVIIPVSRLSY